MIKQPNQSLYQASMILGVLTIITTVMMTVYIPYILGGLAIILGVLSRGELKSFHKSAKIGITVGAIGLVMNTCMIVTSVHTVFSNPDAYREFDQTVQQIYGESFEDMVEDLASAYGFDFGELGKGDTI